MSDRPEWVQNAESGSAGIVCAANGELEIKATEPDTLDLWVVDSLDHWKTASCELDRARVAWLIGMLAHWLAEGRLP